MGRLRGQGMSLTAGYRLISPIEKDLTTGSNGSRKQKHAGLSLRAGGRGFSPATKRMAPGYFYWKIEGK